MKKMLVAKNIAGIPDGTKYYISEPPKYKPIKQINKAKPIIDKKPLNWYQQKLRDNKLAGIVAPLNWYQQKMHDEKVARDKQKIESKKIQENEKFKKAKSEGRVTFIKRQTSNPYNPFRTDEERF